MCFLQTLASAQEQEQACLSSPHAPTLQPCSWETWVSPAGCLDTGNPWVLTTGPQLAHQRGYPGWVSMDGKSIPALHSRVHSAFTTRLFNHSVFPQTVTEHPQHARLLQAERNKASLLRSLIPLGRSRPKHSNAEATPFSPG